jgi:hypothetical protein
MTDTDDSTFLLVRRNFDMGWTGLAVQREIGVREMPRNRKFQPIGNQCKSG